MKNPSEEVRHCQPAHSVNDPVNGKSSFTSDQAQESVSNADSPRSEVGPSSQNSQPQCESAPAEQRVLASQQAATSPEATASPPAKSEPPQLSDEEICRVVGIVHDRRDERTSSDPSEASPGSLDLAVPPGNAPSGESSSWWAESVPQPQMSDTRLSVYITLWGLTLAGLAAGAIGLAIFWDQLYAHYARMRALAPSTPFSEEQTAEENSPSITGRIDPSAAPGGKVPPSGTATVESWEVRLQKAAELLRLPPQLPQTAEELNREAFLVCEHLIEDLPDRPEPLALAAMLHNRQGKHAEAEKFWQKALELNPNFAPAYNGLGWLAARREALDDAVHYLRKAVQLDPYAGHSHSLLVDVLLRQNKIEEALVAARTYVAQFPKAGDSNYWLGQALLQMGQLEEAKKAHLAAIEFEPDYTAAYHSLSIVCTRLGQREEAKKWRSKFAELKEKDMEADRQRSRQYQDLPTQQRLAANYHLAAGNVHTSFGDLRKAEAHWVRGAAIAPQTIDCRLALADFYERAQRLPEAHEQWREIVRQPSPLAGHWFRKGEVEKRLGLFGEAEQSYRQAAALAPQAPEPYVALVDLAVQYGQHLEDAPALAEKAVLLAPTPQNYFALSAVREMTGDVQGALKALEEALRREPSHPLLQVAYKELQDRVAKASSHPKP